jgi:hypothetical protein
MAKPTNVKVAYNMSATAKHKLATLKADLRLKGLPATEIGILELLIEGADENRLAAAYRKMKRD